MKTIAWIGTGVMGYSMANHLIQAGYPLRVFNRTFEKTEGLNAVRCKSIQEVVSGADVIISIVGYPQDVLETYTEVFKYASKNALCIDMTTSNPALAQTLAEQAKSHQLRMLDAPVSGGDIGAKNAALTIMVGGNLVDFNEAKELFNYLGKSITYLGQAGMGQHCKMANQIVIAGNLVAVSESLAYAQNVGLDPTAMLQAISGGSAASWQLINNGPKMIQKDYRPGFFIHHFIKDLKLVLAEFKSDSVELSVTQIVLDKLQNLVVKHPEDANLGTQAIIKAFDSTNS